MTVHNSKKDSESPATTSFEWDAMIDSWSMIDTLLAGTDAMREAGTVYMPKHPEESDENYRDRLETNILFNAMELTLDHFVGRPFSDPVRLNNDVPEVIAEHADNIDLQGSDLTAFAREWFREGVAKGFAHVLIDMPAMMAEERSQRTRDDDLREGRRPFWSLVRPENLIFAEAEIVADPQSGELRERYTHVRLREQVVVRDGFAQVVKDRIRVIEPRFFAVYEQRKTKKGGKVEWVVIEQGETDLDFVPMVTYYSRRDGFLRAKPPLEDLAFMNIRHWQSMSDQINILTVIRFPMLAVAGATEQGGAHMAIGPRQLLSTKDPNGRFYYIEHAGKSIESGWREMEKLEQDMEAYGATFLKKDPGGQTATGRALDSAESVTPLQDMTLRFINAVNNALSVHAAWMQEPAGGTVTITTDFGPEDVSDEDLNFISGLRKGRDISRVTILREAQRRGALAEDFDSEADFAHLIEEDKVLKPLQPQIPGTFDPSETLVENTTPPSAGSEDDDPQPKQEEDDGGA